MKRNFAMFWLVVNAMAFGTSFSEKDPNYFIAGFNFLCVVLLWAYLNKYWKEL